MELAGGRSGPATPAVQAENRRSDDEGCLEGLRQAVRGNRPAHPALLAGSQQTREVGLSLRPGEIRVPDAVQRPSRCSAEPGPNVKQTLSQPWTPDQPRTTPQVRRAA